MSTPRVRRKEDWLSAVADPLERYLFFIQDTLRKANVPYAQGLSIMLLTLSVKLITFPATKKQARGYCCMAQYILVEHVCTIITAVIHMKSALRCLWGKLRSDADADATPRGAAV